MVDVKRYRQTGKPIDPTPTKYDTFKLVKLGEYKMQRGSGRSEAFALAKDGQLIGTWTKKCAEIGIDSIFAVNCIQKLMTTKNPGWGFSDKNADGLTYEEVKGSRKDPKEKKAKVEKKAAKAAKKAAKADKPKRVRKPKADAEPAGAIE